MGFLPWSQCGGGGGGGVLIGPSQVQFLTTYHCLSVALFKTVLMVKTSEPEHPPVDGPLMGVGSLWPWKFSIGKWESGRTVLEMKRISWKGQFCISQYTRVGILKGGNSIYMLPKLFHKTLSSTTLARLLHRLGMDFFLGHHSHWLRSHGAFTLDVKLVLNENLSGILGGTQC